MNSYIEIESLNSNWIGTIFIKVIKETKNYYFTEQNPYLGIVASNYKDREKNIIRWCKNKYENNGIKIHKFVSKLPANIDSKRIYD